MLIASGLFKVDLAETVWIWGLLLLELLAYTFLAVTVHRMFILGNDSVGRWGLIGRSKRDTYLAINLIVIIVLSYIAVMAMMIPVMGILLATQSWSLILGILFLLVPLSCWVLGRMSLLFPAISVDENIDFSTSWAMTKSHQLMMALIIFFSITVGSGQFFPGFANMAYADVIALVYNNVVLVMGIALLSTAYKRIKASHDTENSESLEVS